MTLTTNGKNYIAQKFGLSNCYTATGLSWTAVANDGNQVNETGGTASIVGRLVTTSIYASVIINSVTYTYAQLRTANDNTDLTLSDAQWVAANDGTPTGEAQYCYTCIPNWTCELPLNGYESDGCGNRRLNSTCNPCVPNWQCEIPLNGYESDGCGNRRLNSSCNACVPNWVCEYPLNGYESDGCGNRRLNSACNPCVPNWMCEYPLNGYETDGCGNRRLNSACNPCTPNWQCELPLNGYESDGCGNRRLNSACNPITTGSISFTSTPSNASITLDSVNLGQVTPYTKSGVSAGNHSYLLKLSGYKDYLGTVTVIADQTITVTATLILDVAMDKITLNDSFTNYTCYGFTVPKDEFSCNTDTFKVYAIYSNGYCDVPPSISQFVWYKWDTIELRFIEYMRTSIFSTGTGYCTTEANLPCNNMYKVTYQTTEKILTIEKQTVQEFGMGMAAVGLVGLFLLSKMVSKK